jgi:hypothetical protein
MRNSSTSPQSLNKLNQSPNSNLSGGQNLPSLNQALNLESLPPPMQILQAGRDDKDRIKIDS